MNSKIEKSFQNSQYYRNYNEINQVVLKFEKIKNEYNKSKKKYKNNLISIINTLNNNKIQQKYIKNLLNRNKSVIFEEELNNSISNEIYIDENILNSCRKILDEKINISHYIKKYVKYSENINEVFIKSIKIGNIKNINFLIKCGEDIQNLNDYAFRKSSKYGNIDAIKFFVEKGVNIHTDNDYAIRKAS
jgi:hypothetical protein